MLSITASPTPAASDAPAVSVPSSYTIEIDLIFAPSGIALGKLDAAGHKDRTRAGPLSRILWSRCLWRIGATHEVGALVGVHVEARGARAAVATQPVVESECRGRRHRHATHARDARSGRRAVSCWTVLVEKQSRVWVVARRRIRRVQCKVASRVGKPHPAEPRGGHDAAARRERSAIRGGSHERERHGLEAAVVLVRGCAPAGMKAMIAMTASKT